MPRACGTGRAHRGCALFGSGAGAALLLAALLVFLAAPARAAGCAPDRIDARARLGHVHDGDTLVLEDGRKVRLIGVNAPELPRNGRPGEPGARAARDALRALLEPYPEMGLRFDAERHDRYGRLLAHLYVGPAGTTTGTTTGTTPGEAPVSVQRWLLARGYAVAIVVPPNVWNSDCYREAERAARAAGVGIWSRPDYRPLDARRLVPGTRGFRLIAGRVVRVGDSRKSVWLNLEGGVALRIARKDLRYFGDFDPRGLLQRTVVARGWLVPWRDRLIMQVRHPYALEVSGAEVGVSP